MSDTTLTLYPEFYPRDIWLKTRIGCDGRWMFNQCQERAETWMRTGKRFHQTQTEYEMPEGWTHQLSSPWTSEKGTVVEDRYLFCRHCTALFMQRGAK